MRKITIISIFILSLMTVNMAFAAEQPEMSVYVADIGSGETAHVLVNLSGVVQGNVSVSVDGKDVSANVVDGQATVNLTGLKDGDYVVKVTYGGNENYSNVSKEVNLKVGNGSANNTTNVTGNASGEPIATQNVTGVTGDNATNTTNTTNTTNVTPAKKVTTNTTQTVKKPKKQVPNPLHTLNDKNTGLPVLLLLLVAIGAVFAISFRKQ